MWRFTHQTHQKRLQPKTACSFPQRFIDCSERPHNGVVLDHNEPAAIPGHQRRQIVSEVLPLDIQH